MKILNITAQKPHSTGSGVYLTEIVKAFDRMGHRQAVVAGIYPDDSVEFPFNVKFYPVFFNKKNSTRPDKLDGPDFPIVGMSDEMPYESTRYRDMTEDMVACFGQHFIETISQVIAEFKPDIIICHHLFLLTAMVRKSFPEKEIYGICHGSDIRQLINCEHLREYIIPQLTELDRIYALHEEQKRQLLQILGMGCADKLQVVGSGYNCNIFNSKGRQPRGSEDAVRICYAGKMSSAKGTGELLEALEELTAQSYLGQLPGLTAVLAGGCNDACFSEKLKNLPSNVKYLGQISQRELADIMRSSDIFVLPSYYEGLPLVLVEAMACGAIPICTRLPGVKSWIDDNVGNPNVKYIDMPSMAGVDEPTELGRICFGNDLLNCIRETIIELTETDTEQVLPDTSEIGWDGVAKKLICDII